MDTQANAQCLADSTLARIARGVKQRPKNRKTSILYGLHHKGPQGKKNRLSDQKPKKKMKRRKKNYSTDNSNKQKSKTEDTNRATKRYTQKRKKYEIEGTRRYKTRVRGKEDTKGRHWSIQTRKVAQVAPC